MSGQPGPLPAPLDPPALDAGLPRGVAGLFTTRYGGVSQGRWRHCNLSEYVGDDQVAVAHNRARLLERLGGAVLATAQQVHGRDALVVDDSWRADLHAEADALVTRRPLVALAVLAADCLPVLLADPQAGVVGAAHAGRVGLAVGVLQATVEALVGLGAEPGRTVAVIGPGVCGGCYEVPAEMRDEVAAAVPGSAARTRDGAPALDLAAGAERVLRAAGVGDVRRTGVCTMEDERFYSHRREGLTGRFAGVVMLGPRD